MKKLIVLVFIIFIGSSFIGCGKQQTPADATKKTVLESSVANSNTINSQEFINSIEKSGCKITASKQEGKGILTGNLTRLSISGITIGIYEYKSGQEMEQDAKTISTDGSMIGNAIYDWTGKPHFYKGGNVIVTYIGDNKVIIEKIENIMGKQFAGAK